MTKNEYIAIRISELEARQRYCQKFVMNRDMEHQAKMCDVQIDALLKERELVVLDAHPTLKVGPVEQVWVQGSNPQQLIHTDDHGNDTVLCEDHVGEALSACRNCQPWPSLKNISTHNRNL